MFGMKKHKLTLSIRGNHIFSFGELVAIIDNSDLLIVNPNYYKKHIDYIKNLFDLDLLENYKNQ